MPDVADPEVKAGRQKVLLLPSAASRGLPVEQQVAVSADEVTEGLVSILAKHSLLNEESDIASHSLKATLLTIAGMDGVSSESRQFLGYHVVKGLSSSMNYNRDNLSLPMKELDSTMLKVKSGEFNPDARRSQRYPQIRKSAADRFQEQMGMTVREFAVTLAGETLADRAFGGVRLAEPTAPLTPTEVPSVSEEELSSDGEAEMREFVNECDEDPALKDQEIGDLDEVQQSMLIATLRGEGDDVCKPRSVADVNRVYRHVDRGTVHLGHTLDPLDKLGCERSLTANYVVESETRFDKLFPKCKDCFGLKK